MPITGQLSRDAAASTSSMSRTSTISAIAPRTIFICRPASAAACCAIRRRPPAHGASRLNAEWGPVEGKGAVHSYTEVHHAIQPAFREHTPYLVLLVDLDTQKGEPTEDEALRVVGNLTTPDGSLRPPDMVKRVGIGTRVRMVFTDVAPRPRVAAMDDRRGRDAARKPWRYPQE